MFDNLQANAYSLLTSYKFWMIILIIILFLYAASWVYKKYIEPKLNPSFVPNNEFINDDKDGSGGGQEVELLMFTVEWCPHSKNAIPIWEELKEEYNLKEYNGYKLIFRQIDGEKNPELADKYKIEGYPTIKLVKGNQVIEYDAKPTVAHLKEFLAAYL
tara:strand:- start:22354 stop:22830 length:477 start_codon:yes stop_codon:yes gene_type:complete